MKSKRFPHTVVVNSLCLLLILSVAAFPLRAGNIIESSPTSFEPGAIGIIQSNGVVMINGKEADGSFTIWGDELIKTTAQAKLVFGTLGEVALAPGSSVQLKMENERLLEAVGNSAFSATLLAGEMNIKLQNETGGLVNTVASEITAAKGSSFKVDLKEGRAMVQAGSGTVTATAFGSISKTSAEKSIGGTTTAKDAQYLSAKKLEKLIGNYKLTVPTKVITEASRRENEMNKLNKSRATFLSSLSLNSSAAFFSDKKPNIKFERNIGAADSISGLLINGRFTSGSERLWGGETIEAPQGSGGKLSFPSIAQLVLNSGAKAKATLENLSDTSQYSTSSRVLAAELFQGDIQLRFEKQASGYVRAGNAVMASTRGAHFRVESRDGEGAVDVHSGSVMIIGNWPLLAPTVTTDENTGNTKVDTSSYKLLPVNLSSILNVQVNQSRQIQMRVTDANDKPVANVPVLFSLQGSGSLGGKIFNVGQVQVLTDARGIAIVPYHASSTKGTATVRSEIPGTTATATTTANVTTQQPRFASWQGGLPAVITAAAAIGITAGVWMTRENSLPIKGTGDTIIIP